MTERTNESRAHETTDEAARTRSHRRIAMILGAAATVFACGGGVALVATFVGRPGEPEELPVTATLPLMIGDRLVMHVDEGACDVELLAVLDDGRVVVIPCGGGAPVTVARNALRARLYRRGARAPRAGDVVVRPADAAAGRSLVVTTSRGEKVCVRPEADATIGCTDVPVAGLAPIRHVP